MCVRGGVALISEEVGVYRAHQTCLITDGGSFFSVDHAALGKMHFYVNLV